MPLRRADDGYEPQLNQSDFRYLHSVSAASNYLSSSDVTLIQNSFLHCSTFARLRRVYILILVLLKKGYIMLLARDIMMSTVESMRTSDHHQQKNMRDSATQARERKTTKN